MNTNELKNAKEFVRILAFHGYIDHDPTKLDELVTDYYPLKEERLSQFNHIESLSKLLSHLKHKGFGSESIPINLWVEICIYFANNFNPVDTNISDKKISLERAKKYARHQHFLGSQGKDLVEFDDWKSEE